MVLMANREEQHNKWEKPVFLDKISPVWYDRWKEYRRTFRTYPFAKFKALCSDAWHDFENAFYTIDAITQFFNTVNELEKDIRVMELGGANGYLARDIFDVKHLKISKWVNWEICDYSRDHPVCVDPRYSSKELKEYFWDVVDYQPYLEDANVLVAAHVFEHFPEDLLLKTLAGLDRVKSLKYLCVEMPIYEDCYCRYWTDSHLLQCGWQQIVPGFIRNGFGVFVPARHKHVRGFIHL